MPQRGAVARWLTASPSDRQQSQEIHDAYHRFELGEIEVAGLGHITKRAMLETMHTNVIRSEAERLAPDAAELYAILSVASAVEMAAVISRVNRPGYRR
jgi:hypothetical protein